MNEGFLNKKEFIAIKNMKEMNNVFLIQHFTCNQGKMKNPRRRTKSSLKNRSVYKIRNSSKILN